MAETFIDLPVSFRSRPYYKIVGIGLITFFSSIVLFSVYVILANSDGSFKNPYMAATIFGVFWSFVDLLAVYILISSFKYRLVIDGSMISQTDAFLTRRIIMNEIVAAYWRNWPAGYSIKIRTSDSSMAIDFATLQSQHRDWLINFLRSTIPETKQFHWDKFLLNPEREVTRTVVHPLRTAMIFYSLAVFLVVAWFSGLGDVNLLGALLNFGYATFVLVQKSRNTKPDA